MSISALSRRMLVSGLAVATLSVALAGTAAGDPPVGSTSQPAQAASQAAAPAGAPAPAPSGADRPVDPIAHDPTMVKEGAYYYVIITGDSGSPQTYLLMKRSKDLVHWTELGPVFHALPSWIPQALGVTPADAWAPDLNYVNGKWYLYYAASQFGTENSVIALAVTKSLDPANPDYGWVDHGLVLRSVAGDAYNAIDPSYTRDAQGKQWLSYGSFYGGIAMRRLDSASGMLSAADTAVYHLASRVIPDAEEGPSIVHHGDYYYLFIAFDFCCRGVNSDYRVMVGRSKSITGPYLDQAGVPMSNGGGTEVLRGYNEFIGTGGADVYVHDHVDYFINHYYDGTDNGTPRLNVRTLSWPSGWPQVSEPRNPSRTVGHGSAYVSIVSASSGLVVSDVGCGYEGSNIALQAPRSSTCQQWQYVDRGNGAASILNRFSNKVAEVAACNNIDGGNVAQWGWLGFLANNDCQRWTSTATGQGWTTIKSILPGTRAMDVAGCGTGEDTNIDVLTPMGGPCQQFRLAPVGNVLLADPLSPGGLPVVQGCGAAPSPGSTAMTATSRCEQWRFVPTGGAAYLVKNSKTGRRLTGCAVSTVKAEAPPTGCTEWTLVPGNDGTWSLGNLATGAVTRIKLLRP